MSITDERIAQHTENEIAREHRFQSALARQRRRLDEKFAVEHPRPARTWRSLVHPQLYQEQLRQWHVAHDAHRVIIDEIKQNIASSRHFVDMLIAA